MKQARMNQNKIKGQNKKPELATTRCLWNKDLIREIQEMKEVIEEFRET